MSLFDTIKGVLYFIFYPVIKWWKKRKKKIVKREDWQ